MVKNANYMTMNSITIDDSIAIETAISMIKPQRFCFEERTEGGFYLSNS